MPVATPSQDIGPRRRRIVGATGLTACLLTVAGRARATAASPSPAVWPSSSNGKT
jgi:hypothetical protein